jgi:aminoglycoside phosphotransferase family enzyme/predicted kinase
MSTQTEQIDIEALLNPGLYPHQVEKIHLVETHISWVILTGPYAYKVKKALNLGFLDFSTLAKRKFFCEEEIRLNGRLAPHVYLDVVAITGPREAPRLAGEGAAIEYAVRMLQFPQEGLLDRLIARDALRPAHIDAITALVAHFHDTIPEAPGDTAFGTPQGALAPVVENFRQVLARERDLTIRARLHRLQDWSEQTNQRLSDVILQRKVEGRVRECHGDMHLGNMALVEGEILIFDGIEFNENLRWIDVMSEVAFLTSDLQHRGRPDYGWRFLNGYLELSGDYPGLAVLRYYQAYRAMVRAKVARIRLGQDDLTDAERRATEADFLRYLSQAEGYTQVPGPRLILMRGVSGSGKTVISRQLLEHLGAVRLRSDVERKRLFGLSAEERSDSALGGGIYSPEATQKTYRRLRELADRVLDAGYPVILDATFLRRAQRDPFRTLAQQRQVPFAILDVRADESVLRRRVADRMAAGRDASEAGVAVLEHQLAEYAPLDADEARYGIAVDSGGETDVGALVGRLLGAPG